MAVGSNINAVDYNTIRNTVVNILGVGAGPLGYGQSIYSTDVAPGQTVTKLQWDALRFDLVNIRLHQDGVVPGLAAPLVGTVVKFGAGHPNNQYTSQGAVALINKFKVGVGQFVVEVGSAITRSGSWSNSLTTTVTATFNSADNARFFFNSGGKLRFTSAITGNSTRVQSTAWVNLLNAAGVLSFGADSAPINFYSLTATNQIWINSAASSAYAANRYSILVRSNIANNSAGGATILTFTIQWIDGYTSIYGDSVNGTLRLSIDQLRAAGAMLPSGTFLIQSPILTTSVITGS